MPRVRFSETGRKIIVFAKEGLSWGAVSLSPAGQPLLRKSIFHEIGDPKLLHSHI